MREELIKCVQLFNRKLSWIWIGIVFKNRGGFKSMQKVSNEGCQFNHALQQSELFSGRLSSDLLSIFECLPIMKTELQGLSKCPDILCLVDELCDLGMFFSRSRP